MCSESLWQQMHLLAFADSAFPVGGFAFSNTLESAVAEGVVTDAASLEEYVHGLACQSATTDSVASLTAWRAARDEDLDAVIEADRALLRSRASHEARAMLCRMGRRAVELSAFITQNPIVTLWSRAVDNGTTPGCYPTAQALNFFASGLGERELFAAQQYGVLSQATQAALRIMRITHFDTQLILYRAAAEIDERYEEVRHLELHEMNAFNPQVEILGSIHEKGRSRMFMN